MEVVLQKLLEVDFDELNEGLKLEYLRAVSLTCIRGGKMPSDNLKVNYWRN